MKTAAVQGVVSREVSAGRSARPVFVFGISGATWRVIDPLLAAGRLPHFERLQDQGCRATVLSVRVPGDKHYRQQVAWASLATGCEPARHGITRFFHSADDLKVPSLWEIFQDHGLSAGVYGWPLDWPPRRTNGFIIPSHLARDSRTWPPDLSAIKALDLDQRNAERGGDARASPWKHLQTALALHRHGAQLRTLSSLAGMLARSRLLADAEERSLLLRNAKLELSADLFLGLCRRFDPDFRSFHTFLVDFVSHRFWRYFEPQLFPDTEAADIARFRNAVADAYVRTDAALGRLLATLPRDAVLCVVSEHGMQAEPVSAEVGRWRWIIDPNRLSKFAGIGDDIVGVPVARWIAYRARAGMNMPADTSERLRSVRVAETNLPLFEVYQHGSDEIVVKLSIDADVPRYRDGDIENLTVCHGDVHVPITRLVRRLGKARSAMHGEQGILLLCGPGLRRGLRLADVHLTDLAPTLLRAAGLPVPSGLDGESLDVFGEAAPCAASRQ